MLSNGVIPCPEYFAKDGCYRNFVDNLLYSVNSNDECEKNRGLRRNFCVSILLIASSLYDKRRMLSDMPL